MPDHPVPQSEIADNEFSAHDAVLGWVKDIAPYGIFTTDTSFRIQSWNQWLATRSGMPATDLIGQMLPERFPELVDRGIHRRYQNALRGEISVLSAALHRYLLPFPSPVADLHAPHMLQTVRIAPLVMNHQIVGTITIIEDVTERETHALIMQRQQQHEHMLSRALSVLLRANDPMRGIAELFPSFVPALGIDAFFTHITEADSPTLHLSASGGILARLKDDLATFAPGEGPCGASSLDREPVIVPDLQATTDPRYRDLRGNGMRLFACFPVVIGDHLHGTLSVGSYNEISLADDEAKFLSTLTQYLALAMERVRRETQLIAARTTLQEHAGDLEQKVRERTALLHDTIAQLESFSYTVAHDLRAPIRALQGYSEVLAEEFGHLLPADGQLTVSRLARASKRLDVLTRDLLRFSKVARADVELEPVDVADVIEELKSEAPQSLQNALAVQTPLGVAQAQRTLLQQCLANLIENAVKFAHPQRALLITIRSEQTAERTQGSSTPSLAFNPATFGAPKSAAETAALSSGAWLRIWVEDNGIGIPDRSRAKIFGIFERSAGSENIEGTGIGLAIVARAMQQMGGFCGVESTIGEGSRFWLELPAA